MTRRTRKKHVLPSHPMPVPFGAHALDHGVQFTICSRYATRVWLMLFDAPDAATPIAEYELTPEKHRIGDIWHILVENAKPGQFYLYRMEGRAPKGYPDYYDPNQWLLDPYALAVVRPGKWGDSQGLIPGRPLKSGPAFPKGIIIRDDFDWSEDHTPRIPLSETIIYELHVRGFTVHPSSAVRYPGTFRGLAEKIPYLQELGITAVELLPVQEFNEMEYFIENGRRRNLRNFWGYSTLAFFAPNGRYAVTNYGQQVREFQEMVMAFHKANIEVILDVVFNHTAEGGNGGPTYSFRGIDNSLYYMMDPKNGTYLNFSGCGNTVNGNHPVVRSFIMNCLRYWVLNMHVDGFRFDLASVLTRGPNGELLPNPPIVEEIAEDPALRDTKIIAEAWDAAGAYHVGSFPHERFSEWNGQYRDDVRRFWRGDPGFLGRFAARITGSADLYERQNQLPTKSINYVTCHDGFTLNDLVSYEQKHNEANEEDNRDGDSHNFSCNYGIEGPTNDPQILIIRRRQQKNFFATLFLSIGVPMFPAGDEFGRTQRGNNNAYCQDNETSWIDWTLLERNRDLFEFVKRLIAFRKAHPSLKRTSFFKGIQPGRKEADILWFGPRGYPPHWEQDQAVACLINGKKEFTGAATDTDHLFIVYSAATQPLLFFLPDPPGRPWTLALTTCEQPPQWSGRMKWMVAPPRSVSVFASAP